MVIPGNGTQKVELRRRNRRLLTGGISHTTDGLGARVHQLSRRKRNARDMH
jgi:hypothetical protein